MDDSDFTSCYNYPFPSSYNASSDEEEDEDDNWAEPDIGSEDDFQLYETENPSVEPCDITPAANDEYPPRNEQGEGSTSRNVPRQLEPAARFKIHQDGQGSNMKATLTFEPAL